MRKKAEAGYRMPLFDRVFKPKTIQLSNGHTVQQPRSRMPLILILLAATVWLSVKLTGESSDTYYPTQNSRYGSVTVDGGKVLARLRGTWKCTSGDRTLRFSGNTLRMGYGNTLPERFRVVAVHDDYEQDPDCWRIVDADPAREGVGTFGSMCLHRGVIRARIHVCDAEPVDMVFEKQ